jgi:hypothetical protein
MQLEVRGIGGKSPDANDGLGGKCRPSYGWNRTAAMGRQRSILYRAGNRQQWVESRH